MGIVGYGNIGQACAKLAKAYGMKVLALRRNPDLSANDRNVDQVRAPRAPALLLGCAADSL